MRVPPPVLDPTITGPVDLVYPEDRYRIEPIELGPETGQFRVFDYSPLTGRYERKGTFATQDEASAFVQELINGR